MAAAAAATPAPATDGAEKAPSSEAAKAEDNKAATAQPAALQVNKTAADPAPLNNASAKPGETQPAPATPDAAKNTETASSETSKPAGAAPASPQPAATDQAKADPAPDNRIPADQIDRELAASAHRTLPPQTPPAKPQSEQTSLDPAQKPQEQAAPSIELVRPFSDQAGILTIAGKSVRLVGIIPTDVDRMCTGPSGKSWPCGQAARTAFRMYLRGRSIDCDLPSATWQGTVTGACRYVRIDLSAWLVRFGWAEPEPGSPLAALVEEAKEKKRGIYGDDPRKNGKSTLGPALPKEDPLNPI
jgi:endonuclease YncB( thermonuclease family)